MVEQQVANSKTIIVTAEDGVTGRTWLGPDPDGTDGVLGKVNAINIKVTSLEAAGGNNALFQPNHRTGNLDSTNARTFEPGDADSYKNGQYKCVAYEGVGGDVQLEIELEW